ncbi:ABC-type molybdate transport system, periplasmic component [Pelotomaculum thermopropionicum SI]|uniref:ABC-type molybdate transport system, periplasmic component n=1 Tax=Pelotomaculum thermopropionicum (strain DSM 13744 / JCM 10971 / SI) TaxID=370438 RepID=A5D4J6_PELTS|nr:ABC-type molybdate transport system, periplasmic component [Pelotomaculum thermopropionicum SI]
MKKYLFLLIILLLTAAAAAGCGTGKEQPKAAAEPVNLTVSAAASLQDALEELKTVYAGQNPGVTVTYNFAASGTLQKQIEEGAPVDLFISAGKSQMDALSEKGLILNDSRKDLLGNELVLIARKDSELTGFEDLAGPDVARISIGTPETVPAGQYAREALSKLKLWDKLQPKFVLAKDVRQVLTYVETGNVDAGLVYRSDALAGKEIKVVAAAPADSHAPIVYPMAIIKSTKHQKEAEAFASFLSGAEAMQVFTKYGFKTLR